MFIIIIILGVLIAYVCITVVEKADAPSTQVDDDTETIDDINADGLTPVRMPPVGRTSIVGERYRQSSIRNAISGHEREISPMGEWDNTLMLTAAILREPNNQYDRNAVSVSINGILVGYIAKEETRLWQPWMKLMERNLRYPTCNAAVYHKNGGGYEIILHCSPTTPSAANDCPTGYVCLDAEHQVSVLGEELHQDELGIYGVDTFVWVTLEKGEIPKGKYKGSPTYWASLDGIEIGYITATQYEKYKTRLGISPSCCIAFISQGPKKLELSLMLPKA